MKKKIQLVLAPGLQVRIQTDRYVRTVQTVVLACWELERNYKTDEKSYCIMYFISTYILAQISRNSLTALPLPTDKNGRGRFRPPVGGASPSAPAGQAASMDTWHGHGCARQ